MSQTSSTSRSCKKARPNPTGVDRISSLPESVITDILSRLPTKDAIRTCVLSKDWEYKWTSIYNIQIKDANTYSPKKIKKTGFISFVDRVLLLSNCVAIKNFSFSCREKYDSNRVATWICTPFMRHVENMEIIYDQEGIVLPRCLFNCSSLRKLVLKGPCIFRFPTKILLNQLKTLHLSGVEIQNELSSTDKLKVSFPVLEELELCHCTWSNLKLVEIKAPALTRIKEQNWSKENWGTEETLNDCVIKICGAKLEKFESSGYLPESFILSGSSVAFANLRYSRHGDLQILGLRLRKLLKGFSGLKHLELSYSITEALSLSRSSRHPLPTFDMLEHLHISPRIDAPTLMEVLHAAPSLKFLKTPLDDFDDYDMEEEEPLAASFASELKEVHFSNFSGTESQFELAKLLFKNALSLEKVFLDGCGYGSMSKTKIIEQLSSFPKASACLTIVVT